MSDILMDMLKDRVDERVNAAVSEAASATRRRVTAGFLNKIMVGLGCTASQAMDLLGIPEEEQGTYTELLGVAETHAGSSPLLGKEWEDR